MRILAWTLVVLALLAAGCGDEEASSTTSSSTESGATGPTGSTDAQGDASSATGTAPLATEDEAAIEETIKRWLTEGGCERMTDKFLESQTFIENPAEACTSFEQSFAPPAFSSDEIIVSDFEGDSSKARAVVSDDFSNVESTYRLVNEGEQWQIDAVDF